MLTDFIKYTRAADLRVIDAFRKAGKPLPDAEKLFSHVLNSQHVWLKRIYEEPAEYDIWQIHPPEKFEEIHKDNFMMIDCIRQDFPAEYEVTYRNSKGDEYTSRLEDIFFHMLNHSTYHRAQIATLFKANGLVPPVTDYIVFKRDGLI